MYIYNYIYTVIAWIYMSLRIIIGLSSSIIIILANDAWMGYLEMQSCILPAIKHSGKNPPHDSIWNGRSAMVPFSKIYNIRLKQPWLCRNPGLVDRSWTCQLLVVLISETFCNVFCEPLTCSHSSLSFFILQDSIQFISYPICPLQTQHS